MWEVDVVEGEGADGHSLCEGDMGRMEVLHHFDGGSLQCV